MFRKLHVTHATKAMSLMAIDEMIGQGYYPSVFSESHPESRITMPLGRVIESAK